MTAQKNFSMTPMVSDRSSMERSCYVFEFHREKMCKAIFKNPNVRVLSLRLGLGFRTVTIVATICDHL